MSDDHVIPQLETLDATLDALDAPTTLETFRATLPWDADMVAAAAAQRAINGGGGGGVSDLSDSTRQWYQLNGSYDSGYMVDWTVGNSGGDGSFLDTSNPTNPTITEDGIYVFQAYAEVGYQADHVGSLEFTLSNESSDYPWQKSSSPLDIGVIGSTTLIRRCAAGRSVYLQVFHDMGEALEMTVWVEVQKILPSGSRWPSVWVSGPSNDFDAAVGTIYEVFSTGTMTLPDAQPGDIVGLFSPSGDVTVTVTGEDGLQVDGESSLDFDLVAREYVFFQYAEGIGDAWYVMSRETPGGGGGGSQPPISYTGTDPDQQVVTIQGAAGQVEAILALISAADPDEEYPYVVLVKDENGVHQFEIDKYGGTQFRMLDGSGSHFQVVGTATGVLLKITDSGHIGFFGTNPVAQPTVNNATAADIIAALAALGLIIDGT